MFRDFRQNLALHRCGFESIEDGISVPETFVVKLPWELSSIIRNRIFHNLRVSENVLFPDFAVMRNALVSEVKFCGDDGFFIDSGSKYSLLHLGNDGRLIPVTNGSPGQTRIHQYNKFFVKGDGLNIYRRAKME